MGPLCEDCIHSSCQKIRGAEERDNYGQTPSRRSDECHVCGVEKIEFKGTDNWTKLLVLVGERCAWRVKRSPDFQAVP